ncbi:hypothetical protein PVL30_003032 [Lodderomyces elongisporus]|uniref:uncharacterized protein n=1 Tax=Lodderomyces elongisporus TaxID=36914 RepID=UPI0029211149|nr:uncharacterized protein PVL30_003032 [Lodderomyces elongisporus]WLF79280.1 hypothetical protein PVL30_003032 [Lodderomyces elongisporus]
MTSVIRLFTRNKSYKLIQTGRPNWSKAPPQLKQRYNGIFLILLSVPVIFITTYEMVQRLEGRSTKKVQQGERREDGTKREFSEAEKWQVEKQSLSTKIFGKDFFLDGFTSNTLKQGDSEIKEKTEN